MNKIAITVPCPTCDAPAHYVSALDRYVHADGSSNQDCWLTLLGGKPALRRDDPSPTPATPPIYVPQGYPLWVTWTLIGDDREDRQNWTTERVIAWRHLTLEATTHDPEHPEWDHLHPITASEGLIDHIYGRHVMSLGGTPEESRTNFQRGNTE